jgi:hypothetical protein
VSEPATPAGWATILAAILLPALVLAAWLVAAALEADARVRAGLQRQIDRQDRDIGALQYTVEVQARRIAELEATVDELVALD